MLQVHVDPVHADLVLLDAVAGPDLASAAITWGFLDEALRAARDHRWTFSMAVWSVLASRARRAGVREQVDVDAMTAAIMRRLPASLG